MSAGPDGIPTGVGDSTGGGGPTDPAVLAAECDVLCRWILGAPAEADVEARYRAAHRALGSRVDGVDPAVSLARRGPFAAGLADAWTRVFRPTSLLRRKATLLVAILECRPATAPAFEAPEGGRSRAVVAAIALARGVGFALRLALGSALLARRAGEVE